MRILFVLLFVFAGLSLLAQTTISNFTLNNVSDGSAVELNNYRNMSAVVIIFTSNVCPYDGYYRARIKHLIDAYEGKVQVLLINSYAEADESAAAMKTAYGKWDLPVPYLADKEQTVRDKLGAKKSPESFLLQVKNGQFKVFYYGAIDDNPQMADAVSEFYLKTAIDHLLAGQPGNVLSTRTVGCTIRNR